MKGYIGSRGGGEIRTALFYRLPDPRISVPRTWVPRAGTRDGGNFCHGNIPPATLPRRSTPRHRGHLSNHANPPLPSPDLIFPLCWTRPGVRSLCLEEFLETLLSSDQGRRDFSPDPRLRRRNGNLDKEGEEQRGRVGSRLYRWRITFESLLICLCVSVAHSRRASYYLSIFNLFFFIFIFNYSIYISDVKKEGKYVALVKEREREQDISVLISNFISVKSIL